MNVFWGEEKLWFLTASTQFFTPTIANALKSIFYLLMMRIYSLQVVSEGKVRTRAHQRSIKFNNLFFISFSARLEIPVSYEGSHMNIWLASVTREAQFHVFRSCRANEGIKRGKKLHKIQIKRKICLKKFSKHCWVNRGKM